VIFAVMDVFAYQKASGGETLIRKLLAAVLAVTMVAG